MNISINKKIQKIQIKKKQNNYPYSFLQFPKYFSKSLKLSPNIAFFFFFRLSIWGSLMRIHTKSSFDEEVLNVVRI